MKLEHTIVVSESEDVVDKRAITWLEKAGYKPVSAQSALVYKRGSLFGSRTSFTPRGWECHVTIKAAPGSGQTTHVSICFDINTSGQIVTQKERRFWDTELGGLQEAINSGNIDTLTSTEVAESSLNQNLITILVVFIFAVGVGIFAYIISEKYWIALFTVLVIVGIGLLIASRWLSHNSR